MVQVNVPFGQDTIRTILPHREPFLLVDRVEKLEGDRRIVCVKSLTEDDYYLRRVPGQRPTYPITVLAEIMAQAGAILVLLGTSQEGRRIYFATIQWLELRRPVHAGETLTIEAEILRMRRRFGSLKGVARVGDEQVAEGVMRFAMGASDETTTDA